MQDASILMYQTSDRHLKYQLQNCSGKHILAGSHTGKMTFFKSQVDRTGICLL